MIRSEIVGTGLGFKLTCHAVKARDDRLMQFRDGKGDRPLASMCCSYGLYPEQGAQQDAYKRQAAERPAAEGRCQAWHFHPKATAFLGLCE